MNRSHIKDYSVYPGEYTPMPEIEALIKEVKDYRINPGVQPLLNMEELEDCFEIEMILPGAKRENLFVYINNNILSFVVLHKHCEQNKKLQIHEFDHTCIERNIKLPANADTEFTSAEFRQGILRMHIPKNQHPFRTGLSKQIVIY